MRKQPDYFRLADHPDVGQTSQYKRVCDTNPQCWPTDQSDGDPHRSLQYSLNDLRLPKAHVYCEKYIELPGW